MTGLLSESQALKQSPSASARKRLRFCVLTGLTCLLLSSAAGAAESGRSTPSSATNLQIFDVKGVVLSLDITNSTVTVRHEAVSNYMPAMTMPFHVKAAKELGGLKPQDVVTFRLLVTDDESWVDRIKKVGTAPLVAPESGKSTVAATTKAAPAAHSSHPLLDYKFTNELGQAVSLNDFRGQALGITFFFTRCPVPDYCPRLSKNFSEASQQLSSMTNAPTNWHFISVSFDPTFDTPEVLKAYAERYQYDPKHWNFLTGPEDKIKELARLSGVETKSDVPGLIDHNFRTLIIDAAGHLQTTIPFGGNFSEFISKEMLKAAAAVPTTNTATAGSGVPPDSSGAGPHPAATTSSR
jgi:protein SCO1/2